MAKGKIDYFHIAKKAVEEGKPITNNEIKFLDPELFVNAMDIATHNSYHNVAQNSRLTNLLDVGKQYVNMLQDHLIARNGEISESYKNSKLSKLDYTKRLLEERANQVRNPYAGN